MMREWKRKILRASAWDCSNGNDDEIQVTASDGDGSNVNNVEEDGSNVNGDGNEEKDESEGDDSRGRTTEGLDGDDDVPLLVPS